MSVGELATVVLAVAGVMVAVGLLIGLGALLRTLATVRHAVTDVHARAVVVLDEAHQAVRQASDDLDEVDDLIHTASTITHTVDTASRLAYTAFSSPVVKGLALATGVGRAARRIRGRD